MEVTLRRSMMFKFHLSKGEFAALRLIAVDRNETISEALRVLIRTEAARRGFGDLGYLEADKQESNTEKSVL